MKDLLKNNIFFLLILVFAIAFFWKFSNKTEKTSNTLLEKQFDLEKRANIKIKANYLDSIFTTGRWHMNNKIKFNGVEKSDDKIIVKYTLAEPNSDNFYDLIFNDDSNLVKEKNDSLWDNSMKANEGVFTFKEVSKKNDTLYVTVPVSLLTNFLYKTDNFQKH